MSDTVCCPECGSERVRVMINSRDVGIIDCGGCYASTNSRYGDVEVVE